MREIEACDHPSTWLDAATGWVCYDCKAPLGWRDDDAPVTPDPKRCSTPGCPGDYRYAAPGRGHIEGCAYPTPGEVGLSEAERTVLLDVIYAYANPFDDDNPTPEWLGVVAAVERILAARTAALQAEWAEKEFRLGQALVNEQAQAVALQAEVAEENLAAALHRMAVEDNPGHADWINCPITGPCADEGLRLRAALGGEHDA